MYTDFIRAHDGPTLRSQTSSTCCASVDPMLKEKPATVIAEHVRLISVTLALSKLAEQVSTKA